MPAEIQVGRTYNIADSPGFLFVPQEMPREDGYIVGKLLFGCLAGHSSGRNINRYTEIASRLHPAPYNEMET